MKFENMVWTDIAMISNVTIGYWQFSNGLPVGFFTVYQELISTWWHVVLTFYMMVLDQYAFIFLVFAYAQKRVKKGILLGSWWWNGFESTSNYKL